MQDNISYDVWKKSNIGYLVPCNFYFLFRIFRTNFLGNDGFVLLKTLDGNAGLFATVLGYSNFEHKLDSHPWMET